MNSLESVKRVYETGVEAMGTDDPVVRVLVLALAMAKNIIGAEQFDAMNDEQKQKIVLMTASVILNSMQQEGTDEAVQNHL